MALQALCNVHLMGLVSLRSFDLMLGGGVCVYVCVFGICFDFPQDLTHRVDWVNFN